MSLIQMTFDRIAAEIISAAQGDPRIVISPIMWSISPSDGAASHHERLFYSVITAGFRREKILIVNPIERLEIIGRLYVHQPALDLYFPKTELETLRLAERFWSCSEVVELHEWLEAKLKEMEKHDE